MGLVRVALRASLQLERRYSTALNEKVLYSSINETLGRGRIRDQRIFHGKLHKENEIRSRQCEMLRGNDIPVALSLIYEGFGRVQKEMRVEEKEKTVPSKNSTESQIPPFSIYQDLRVDENEDVDFECLGPDFDRLRAQNLLADDEMFIYGSADPNVEVSDILCVGCGASLHCQDPKIPGFIPSELFKDLRSVDICQRCHVMKRYNIALKLNVSPEDYPKTIEHIRTDKNALIVLVVDVADFPGSVYSGISDIIGSDKEVILVGNKIDLIPPDCSNYLKHIRRCIVDGFIKKSSISESESSIRVVDSVLVSAMTGYNIEVLIDMIFKNIYAKFKNAASEASVKSVYLIGSTNVGKSSIFNMFLNSDLCKHQAHGIIEKATVTPVPGTTLNLLKFPLTRPDPSRMNQRLIRLSKDAKILSEIEKKRIALLWKTKETKLMSPIGIVGRTFGQDKCSSILTFNFNPKKSERTIPKRLNPKNPDFVDGKWFYDTPGTVSNDQIINLLAQEELKTVLPSFTIQPRSFLLRVGCSIILGGICRLDVVEGPKKEITRHPLRITVFCSSDLPIHILETLYTEEFIRKNRDILRVPLSNRTEKIPELNYKEFYVESKYGEKCVDIVFSSIGWISCFPKTKSHFSLHAWTPGAKGLAMRDPSFLPFAYNYRGHRIDGTPAFKNDEIFLPA